MVFEWPVVNNHLGVTWELYKITCFKKHIHWVLIIVSCYSKHKSHNTRNLIRVIATKHGLTKHTYPFHNVFPLLSISQSHRLDWITCLTFDSYLIDWVTYMSLFLSKRTLNWPSVRVPWGIIIHLFPACAVKFRCLQTADWIITNLVSNLKMQVSHAPALSESFRLSPHACLLLF